MFTHEIFDQLIYRAVVRSSSMHKLTLLICRELLSWEPKQSITDLRQVLSTIAQTEVLFLFTVIEEENFILSEQSHCNCNWKSMNLISRLFVSID